MLDAWKMSACPEMVSDMTSHAQSWSPIISTLEGDDVVHRQGGTRAGGDDSFYGDVRGVDVLE